MNESAGSEQDRPLVSVVVATYNMGQHIEGAIDSILQQSFRDLEVIVVDDGSSDDTQERLQQYRNDERVRIIRTDNQGQPKAKNLGIQNARGKYIAFCDADDLWAPDKLERQIPVFIQDPEVGVVYTDVKYIDERGEVYEKEGGYKRYSGFVTDKLLIKNFVPFGTSIIRRECLDQVGLFDESLPMGIDWDLWLRLSVFYKFQFVEAKTYFYREWPGQMSNNYRSRYQYASIILERFISRNGERLTPKEVNEAWKDLFRGKAAIISAREKTLAEPLLIMWRCLLLDLVDLATWKTVAKILLKKF